MCHGHIHLYHQLPDSSTSLVGTPGRAGTILPHAHRELQRSPLSISHSLNSHQEMQQGPRSLSPHLAGDHMAIPDRQPYSGPEKRGLPGPGPAGPSQPYLAEPDLFGKVFDELRGLEVLWEFIFMLCQSLQDSHAQGQRSATESGRGGPPSVPRPPPLHLPPTGAQACSASDS